MKETPEEREKRHKEIRSRAKKARMNAGTKTPYQVLGTTRTPVPPHALWDEQPSI